jgi:hypothetical protein
MSGFVAVLIAMLVKAIDNNILGGWIRAAVAAILGAASGWFGGALAPYLTADFQIALGVVVSTIVIGIWSWVAKKFTPPAPPPAS